MPSNIIYSLSANENKEKKCNIFQATYMLTNVAFQLAIDSTVPYMQVFAMWHSDSNYFLSSTGQCRFFVFCTSSSQAINLLLCIKLGDWGGLGAKMLTGRFVRLGSVGVCDLAIATLCRLLVGCYFALMFKPNKLYFDLRKSIGFFSYLTKSIDTSRMDLRCWFESGN